MGELVLHVTRAKNRQPRVNATNFILHSIAAPTSPAQPCRQDRHLRLEDGRGLDRHIQNLPIPDPNLNPPTDAVPFPLVRPAAALDEMADTGQKAAPAAPAVAEARVLSEAQR